MVDAQLFIAKTVFGGYSAMMLLVPERWSPITSSRNAIKCAPALPHLPTLPPPITFPAHLAVTEFWIRGSSVGFFGLVAAIHKMDLDDAVDMSLATVVATALIYPFNAKFGLLSKNLPLNYDGFPNHYVPEVLMASVAALGFFVKFIKK